jgi:hypothetical protein
MAITATTMISACGGSASPTNTSLPIVQVISTNTETEALAEIVAQDSAFRNSGLSQQDAFAICLRMLTGEPSVVSDSHHDTADNGIIRETQIDSYTRITTVVLKIPPVPDYISGPFTDTRIISVRVEPGGDTVHVQTGEYRNHNGIIYDGNGQVLVFVRILGEWHVVQVWNWCR